MRLRQEILLGVGGVRVLRALGLAPKVWHANEGHSAFLTLELYRESIQAGLSHDEAIERIRQCSVFTTHTPVPAGHDVFPFHVMALLSTLLGTGRVDPRDIFTAGTTPGFP